MNLNNEVSNSAVDAMMMIAIDDDCNVNGVDFNLLTGKKNYYTKNLIAEG